MAERTSYRAARLFDGMTPELREDVVVAVRDGVIEEVSAAAGDHADVVDLGQVTLMPGMIDTHVHLTWDGSAEPDEAAARFPRSLGALITARHALEHLIAGVTTVRDLGSPHGHALAAADAVRRGLVLGPRIVAAGQPICMTGGHVWRHLSHEADGPDEVRKAVRRQVREGARTIKLMASGGVCGDAGERPGVPELTQAELAAATGEAHRLGLPVAAHAHSLEAARNAIEAGVDSIEHGSMIDGDTARSMAQRGVYLTPTYTAIKSLVTRGPSVGVPAHVLAKAVAAEREWPRATRTAIEVGVPVVTGTDAGVPGHRHGDVALEVAALASLGLAPFDALLACTSRAADALGLGSSIGRVREGHRADLIAVTGDPLSDVQALTQVRALIVEGRLFRPEDLRTMLPTTQRGDS